MLSFTPAFASYFRFSPRIVLRKRTPNPGVNTRKRITGSILRSLMTNTLSRAVFLKNPPGTSPQWLPPWSLLPFHQLDSYIVSPCKNSHFYSLKRSNSTKLESPSLIRTLWVHPTVYVIFSLKYFRFYT